MSDPVAAPPVPDRRFRLPSWLGRAVFESLLIVFSLLLAVALNNWNEDRQVSERVEQTRAFFAQEVHGNRARLASEEYLPHHLRLHRELTAALNARPAHGAAVRAALEETFRTGVHPFQPRDAVWRSASAGGLLGRMDPREVFALADIYRLQEELTSLNRAMYAALVTEDWDSEDPAVMRRRAGRLRMHLSDVTSMEGELLREYQGLERSGRPR